MTECEAVRELAQAYLDGGLDAPELERFEEHLHGCAVCRQVVASYRHLFAALDAPAIPEPPPGFAARTLARVAAERRRGEAVRSFVAAAAMAVAGAAALLFTWGGLPGEALGRLGELSVADACRAAWATIADLAEAVAAGGSEWLPAALGGPLVVAGLLVALGAETIMVCRWRALARIGPIGPIGPIGARNQNLRG